MRRCWNSSNSTLRSSPVSSKFTETHICRFSVLPSSGTIVLIPYPPPAEDRSHICTTVFPVQRLTWWEKQLPVAKGPQTMEVERYIVVCFFDKLGCSS
ncbi:hypothetical protein AVEN_173091-1 [Araneus ventricosus]|uniref:Uncharacterized protein n=1 Tax=Araneus ventricosus TaxID=182803 RepID=A0A4Y2HRR0_ARAVE|nr:hypothetical protein AVEN_173091-1 [Araneus ventricosus]